MSDVRTPTVETHVPVVAFIPDESNDPVGDSRKPIDPPSLWKRSVRCTHRETGRVAVVQRVDHHTNMFRAFYPDEGDLDPETRKPVGRMSTRLEWEHCRNWIVDVTFSPKELARQAAARELEIEVSKLDAAGLAAVSVLCDDPDPRKSLAKLEALRAMGVLKASTAAAQAAVGEMKKGGK